MSEGGSLSPVRRSAWREAPLDQVNPQRRLVPALEWPDFFPEWQDGTRMLLSPEASHTG